MRPSLLLPPTDKRKYCCMVCLYKIHDNDMPSLCSFTAISPVLRISIIYSTKISQRKPSKETIRETEELGKTILIAVLKNSTV